MGGQKMKKPLERGSVSELNYSYMITTTLRWSTRAKNKVPDTLTGTLLTHKFISTHIALACYSYFKVCFTFWRICLPWRL